MIILKREKLSEMKNRIIEYLRKNKIDLQGKKIIVGFSGGPDSMLLLRFLLDTRNDLDIALHIMHLNHNERPEADKEEQFVELFCKKNDLSYSLYSEQILELNEVNELGFEMAARERRLYYFQKDLKKYNADYIMTGHNLDDRIETMFLNLERGTGLRGLVSMRLISGVFIKPILFLTRKEIRDHINKNNIDYIEDITNLDENLGRNRIRKRVIPVLDEFMKGGIKRIEHSMDILETTENALNKLVNRTIEEISEINEQAIIFNIRSILKMDDSVQRLILYYGVRKRFRVNAHIIDEIIKAIRSEKKYIEKIFNEFSVIRDYNNLIVKEIDDSVIQENELCELKNEIEYNGYKLKKETSHAPDKFDDNRFVCFPKNTGKMYIRTLKIGDRFSPFGLNGTVKLHDFFINNKISRNKRGKIPLLVDSDNEILWITGMRRTSKYPITNKKECIIVRRKKD